MCYYSHIYAVNSKSFIMMSRQNEMINNQISTILFCKTIFQNKDWYFVYIFIYRW